MARDACCAELEEARSALRDSEWKQTTTKKSLDEATDKIQAFPLQFYFIIFCSFLFFSLVFLFSSDIKIISVKSFAARTCSDLLFREADIVPDSSFHSNFISRGLFF